MTKTLHDAFLSYMDDVIPKDAPSLQIQECKRAFVAGAWQVLQTVLDVGDDAVSEDEGIARIEAIRLECERFQRDVLAGKA